MVGKLLKDKFLKKCGFFNCMKILAAGDMHGDKGLAEKLAKRAIDENIDLVILCGDLTYFEKDTSGIIGPFVAADKKVLMVPGNHEDVSTVDFLAKYYNVRNLHGYSVCYGDVGIFGAGGATEVGPRSKITQENMLELLGQGHGYIEYMGKKIMITHEHPTESAIESFTKFFKGSSAIRKAVDDFQPDFLLCSHVHEAEGIEELMGKTKVVNVGKNGKIIEI